MSDKVIFKELDDYESYLMKVVKDFLEKYPDRKERFLEEIGIEKELENPIE